MYRNLDLRFFLFYYLLSNFFCPSSLFWLSVLLSFLLFWINFLSYFVFPFLFWHCFIHVSLIHVISSLAYPTWLELKCLIVVESLLLLKGQVDLDVFIDVCIISAIFGAADANFQGDLPLMWPEFIQVTCHIVSFQSWRRGPLRGSLYFLYH
jgi:hypothetical protein